MNLIGQRSNPIGVGSYILVRHHARQQHNASVFQKVLNIVAHGLRALRIMRSINQHVAQPFQPPPPLRLLKPPFE